MQSLYSHLSRLIIIFLFLSAVVISVTDATISVHAVFPNFTATYLRYIDWGGDFLSSKNAAFAASIDDGYFTVVHLATFTVIWSSNPLRPFSDSAELRLSAEGMAIHDNNRSGIVWSTPPLASPVAFLRLLDTGNLQLVGHGNVTVLWQSFDYPTDCFVTGQRVPVGTQLVAGDFRLTLHADRDLTLDWFEQVYWKLSMDVSSYVDSNKPVSYMEMDNSGLYLFSAEGNSTGVVVMKFDFKMSSDFVIARLSPSGVFKIRGGSGEVLERPTELCRVPNFCGSLGVCSTGENGLVCNCPLHFRRDENRSACLPPDDSPSLSSPCNGTGETDFKSVRYLNLSHDNLDYFSTRFTRPANRSVGLSVCQDLCSQSCSCLGLAYQNHSGTTTNCYLFENRLGSVFIAAELGFSVYVKAIDAPGLDKKNKKRKKTGFPLFGFVLVSVSGLLILVSVLALILLRLHKRAKPSLGHRNSGSFSSSVASSFRVGLPSRFRYHELVEATGDFATKIGSGGFGTVYKGTLPDGTAVAVKKIANPGARGEQEFLTELAVIAGVRHANLVRLIGFCVRRSSGERFLVLEHMSRGSLEKILFVDDGGPVLEWRERLGIALGAARALAYLHRDCDRKIIHCDVKPENILLNEGPQIKVSDFGLSKLLDHETSKVVTAMRGTRGYLAPEWLGSTGITDKSDVFSFGMVLFELVSGRRNSGVVAGEGSSGEYFPSVALEMHGRGRYDELADARMERGARGEEVEMVVRTALCCVHVAPAMRPTMDNVVAMLEGRLGLGNPRIEALGFLEYFGETNRHAVVIEKEKC